MRASRQLFVRSCAVAGARVLENVGELDPIGDEESLLMLEFSIHEAAHQPASPLMVNSFQLEQPQLQVAA